MKFIPTRIPEVLLIEPGVFEDPRGFFFESYQKGLFSRHGINTEFVQDNHSFSKRGVLRGLHFQAEPRAQAKLMRVVKGEIFDVAVDIRENSATFGRHVSALLSAENRKMLYIPAGFAHGFFATQDAEVLYKASDVHSPEHERGILWNDPELGIEWPKLETPYLLSEKDRKYPTFRELVSKK
ncbi:MAG TPA: dTDP-4-dehydrorhamnose 3,5-epimerase [bacterium]|nr:dTDP-4-dehydrorhamnose 3,5-epimerase [bacterium]